MTWVPTVIEKRKPGRPSRTSKRRQNQRQPEVYRKFKKSTCERCGFVPVHTAQLDTHHKDGNFMNNDESNLITLCANCHRLIESLAKIDKRWLLGQTPRL